MAIAVEVNEPEVARKRNLQDHSGLYVEQIDGKWSVVIRGLNGKPIAILPRSTRLSADSTALNIKHAARRIVAPPDAKQ